MNEEYDLANMKSRPNPYAKQLKKQITQRLSPDVIDISSKWQRKRIFRTKR